MEGAGNGTPGLLNWLLSCSLCPVGPCGVPWRGTSLSWRLTSQDPSPERDFGVGCCQEPVSYCICPGFLGFAHLDPASLAVLTRDPPAGMPRPPQGPEGFLSSKKRLRVPESQAAPDLHPRGAPRAQAVEGQDTAHEKTPFILLPLYTVATGASPPPQGPGLQSPASPGGTWPGSFRSLMLCHKVPLMLLLRNRSCSLEIDLRIFFKFL